MEIVDFENSLEPFSQALEYLNDLIQQVTSSESEEIPVILTRLKRFQAQIITSRLMF